MYTESGKASEPKSIVGPLGSAKGLLEPGGYEFIVEPICPVKSLQAQKKQVAKFFPNCSFGQMVAMERQRHKEM